MIYIGNHNKASIIEAYRVEHGISRVIVLSPEKFALSIEDTESIEYAQIIQYKYFYRLLQEIDQSTLLVINECLRTQNRYDLTYNCIRHFLNQTRHQLIFQRFPIIDTIEDFMILFDWDTRSQWKKEPFSRKLMAESRIKCHLPPIQITPVVIRTSEQYQAQYQVEKRRLIDSIGMRDPHTIPRNLHLFGGKAKLSAIRDGVQYVGRNDRFKLPLMATYKEPSYPSAPYTAFEFPHNFIDFADFLALSGQSSINVLTTDLKVDEWYLRRYQAWAGRVSDACTAIS